MRALRNLSWGLLTLVLSVPAILGSCLGVMIFAVLTMILLTPLGILLILSAALAVIAWILLMIPSLIVKQDFTWPCRAAQVIISPNWRVFDWMDEWGDLPLDAFEWAFGIWNGAVWAARHVEGCS